MNSYREFTAELAGILRRAADLPLGPDPTGNRAAEPETGPTMLLFSPHPDDEVITGALPLRLRREAGWRVRNVAVTLGSNSQRRQERLAELKRCCATIGFDVVLSAADGFEQVTREARDREPQRWSGMVARIVELLTQNRPEAICVPHGEDRHPAHEGTHWLVRDALDGMPAEFCCHVVQTEFWHPMRDPNLLVELSPEDLGDLLLALSCHSGEVRRNSYHITLPAWMIDNVRRGAEVVGQRGGSAPSMTFATLYRHEIWRERRLEQMESMPFLPATARADSLFSAPVGQS